MEKTEQINQEVIRLWKDLVKPNNRELMPLLYAPLNKDAEILFIGLNPSFGKKWGYLSEDADLTNLEPNEFFLWRNFLARNAESSDIRKAKKTNMLARKNYPFFKPFQDIAGNLNAKWEHVDLFFYRQTEQKEFKGTVCVRNSFKELNAFGRRQLELSKQLICEFKPKVIVVANASAARIFAREFQVTFDKKLRSDTIQLNGKTVPTILTIMFTRWMSKPKRQQVERRIRRAFLLPLS